MNLHAVPEELTTLLLAYFAARYKHYQFRFKDRHWQYAMPGESHNTSWMDLSPEDINTHIRRAKQWRLTGKMI